MIFWEDLKCNILFLKIPEYVYLKISLYIKRVANVVISSTKHLKYKRNLFDIKPGNLINLKLKIF